MTSIGSLISLVCAWLLLASCSSWKRSPAGPDEVYQSITQQIISYQLDAAQQAARKAWLADPHSQAGWRFKLQYAETLIATDRTRDAAGVLKDPLPPKFSALQPRYDYLKAYIGLSIHDPSAPAAMRAALAEAHAKSDAAVETDALIRLQSEHRLASAEEQPSLDLAIDIARRSHLEYQQANALNQLGLLMLSKERYAETFDYLSQAISHASHAKATYIQAAALLNLGESRMHVGDFGRALDPLLQAKNLLPKDDRSVVAVFSRIDLGTYYSLRQQDQEALRYYREAFALGSLTGGRSRRYIFSSSNLAEGLIQTNNIDEAEKYNQIASRTLHEALRWKSPIEPEWIAGIEVNRADIASARGQLQPAVAAYRKALEILQHGPPNFTQVLAYAGLAETAERLHNNREARDNFDKALASIESNRSRQVSAQYQITFLSALMQFYQQYADFLIRQGQPWTALAVADSSRASVLTQGSVTSRSEPDFEGRLLNLARQSNTAILFYSITPDKSFLWALTPTGKAFKQLNLTAAELEKCVTAYSSLIQHGRRDTLADQNPIGMRLYETLIAPVASSLRTGMRVVIVPDGPLHGLNFETLLVKTGSPHYWLQDVSLTVAPSLRILLDKAAPPRSSDKALVIGDPIYSDPAYPPLPQSKIEIDRVAARFPTGLAVFRQQQAVPSAYQKARPELFSRIHFSAHVDADPQSPLDSAIILSTAPDGNNRLYARDVMKIPLTADLVTVSGCSSVGKTALSGEGMVGFAWAAFDAGAKNAVTSLWEVDDRSTTELMDRFYAGVAGGKPYATALRDAKLQMLLTPFKKPFYWASFQLYSRNIAPTPRLREF